MLTVSRENLSKVKYKFYATLLDAFSYYLNSEFDTAFEEFINKLNRVPFTSEAAAKGTAFNELVDLLKDEEFDPPQAKNGNWIHGGFDFKPDVVMEFANMFRDAHSQVYVEATLPTSLGEVLLYGYQDEVMPMGWISDIKCTGNYEFPKFLANWQHIVYPYCNNCHGVRMDRFTYDVTNYNSIYREEYFFNPAKDVPRLVSHVEHLITFIERHKALITDRKLFALDNVESVAAGAV